MAHTVCEFGPSCILYREANSVTYSSTCLYTIGGKLKERGHTLMLPIYNFISKLRNFNKNYKGLGTTEKGKKQEETQTGR